MVDAVSSGVVAAARTLPVAQAAPITPAADAPTPAPSPGTAAPRIAALAKAMAAAPPVDGDRVAEIKQAIQNGTFPILPATIADQMMAMRYDWMQHDQA